MNEGKPSFSPERAAGPTGDKVAEYGEVSRLAVIAAGCALLSLGTLFWTPFLLLSMVGFVLALFALLVLRVSSVQLVGGRLATVALAMTSFSSAYGIARNVAYDQLLYSEARVQAKKWLNFVRDGNENEAFQVRIPKMARRRQGQTWEEYYAGNQTAREGLAEFYRTSPFKELKEHGRRGQLRFVGNVSLKKYGADEQLVVQKFEFTYQEQGETRSLTLQIALKRRFHERFSHCHWEWFSEVPIIEREQGARRTRKSRQRVKTDGVSRARLEGDARRRLGDVG
ncbi:MAG: hypothetical protein CMJ75_12950 [Planctomycetaceae bacterium]|nr:hypothetical protein [Planctomycetaceae bacterium]